MKQYVNFIMANGYSYTFRRENVNTGDKWPADDTQFFRHVSNVSATTETGGVLVFNLEQCIAVEFFDESMVTPKEKPDDEHSH